MKPKPIEVEELRKIQDVPKGAFLRSTNKHTLAPMRRVYIKGDYVRERKAWECQAWDDMNQYIYLKKDRVVLVGFTF